MWGSDACFLRAGAIALAMMFAVQGAEAADLGELHRMFGVGIGEQAMPPPLLRNIVSLAPCQCPDFCGADLPVLGLKGSMSVRWQLANGTCRADLMTVEGSPLRQPPAVSEDPTTDLFGSTAPVIIARYGTPRTHSTLAGEEVIYCGLVSDYMRRGAALAGDELIFTAFHFDAGRLVAIRVGMTGYLSASCLPRRPLSCVFGVNPIDRVPS